MKDILWTIELPAPPHVTRHCKKCGAKTEFECSGLFRVNAQRRSLDVWLIYKCVNCDSTWNATVLTRVPPRSIAPGLLEGFHTNDAALARRYAMDADFLRGNGAQVCAPDYEVCGESLPADAPVRLTISSPMPLQTRVSAIVRRRTGMSARQYADMAAAGRLRMADGSDPEKARLGRGATLILSPCFSPEKTAAPHRPESPAPPAAAPRTGLP